MDIRGLLNEAGIEDFAALPADSIPMRGGRRPPEGALSAIVCLFPYYAGAFEERNISLYAIGPDYHRVVMEMLENAAARIARMFPMAKLTALVDSSPIDEKAAAQAAGLGEIGRNGLLIAPRWGQYVFIGCLLTSLSCDALGLARRERPSRCEGCGACVAACPTAALETGTPMRGLCRSAITQKKSPITEWEASQVKAGKMAWGCDICQMVCPHNKSPDKTYINAFKTSLIPILTSGTVDEISDRAYLWRDRDVLRRNLSLIAV